MECPYFLFYCLLHGSLDIEALAYKSISGVNPAIVQNEATKSKPSEPQLCIQVIHTRTRRDSSV